MAYVVGKTFHFERLRNVGSNSIIGCVFDYIRKDPVLSKQMDTAIKTHFNNMIDVIIHYDVFVKETDSIHMKCLLDDIEWFKTNFDATVTVGFVKD